MKLQASLLYFYSDSCWRRTWGVFFEAKNQRRKATWRLGQQRRWYKRNQTEHLHVRWNCKAWGRAWGIRVVRSYATAPALQFGNLSLNLAYRLSDAGYVRYCWKTNQNCATSVVGSRDHSQNSIININKIISPKKNLKHVSIELWHFFWKPYPRSSKNSFASGPTASLVCLACKQNLGVVGYVGGGRKIEIPATIG